MTTTQVLGYQRFTPVDNCVSAVWSSEAEGCLAMEGMRSPRLVSCLEFEASASGPSNAADEQVGGVAS